MNNENFLVTFHTHYDALCCIRKLKQTDFFSNKNLNVKMIPVPRAVSSSCGSAVKIETNLLEQKEYDSKSFLENLKFLKNILSEIEFDSFYQIKENDKYEKQ